MSDYFAGVDLGQSRDFTAVAIVERAEHTGEWDAAAYTYRKVTKLQLRYLKRMPLGTPYPEVVERVQNVMQSPSMAGRRYLAVDATGVGRPVVDLLRKADLGCTMWPVLITGGETEGSGQGYFRVPKRDLIVGLQVLLQRHGLEIAGRMSFSETLLKEMADMRVRVSAGGREQFGAWREGQHDDLVLAVALACWGVRRVWREKGIGERTGRLV